MIKSIIKFINDTYGIDFSLMGNTHIKRKRLERQLIKTCRELNLIPTYDTVTGYELPTTVIYHYDEYTGARSVKYIRVDYGFGLYIKYTLHKTPPIIKDLIGKIQQL